MPAAGSGDGPDEIIMLKHNNCINKAVTKEEFFFSAIARSTSRAHSLSEGQEDG